PVELALAQGDQLQLKANALLPDGKELTNGELVTVKKVTPGGQIELKDGRILPDHYREFTRGYAITSYGSRGKTAVKIYTPNKEQLRENVSRMGDRELAVEFAKQDSQRFMPVQVRKNIN